MVNTRTKPVNVLACALGLFFLISGCSSSDDAAQVINEVIDDETVVVSGTIRNVSDVIESGVEVEAVYSDPGDALNPKTTTNDNITENFSLSVLKDTRFFLRATKDTFATINSEKGATSANVTGLDIGIPTVTEAQQVIDLALGEGNILALEDRAWLVVDVEDENGDQVSGQTVTTSVTPEGFIYTDCDGFDSGITTTSACGDNRPGPMYIAYFGAAGDTSVAVAGETKIAPLRMGEVTFLDFEVATAPVIATAFDRGKIKYDADCDFCHAAGSYDPIGESASDLADRGEDLILNLSSIGGMKNVTNLTQQELDDLFAFLEDPSIQ